MDQIYVEQQSAGAVQRAAEAAGPDGPGLSRRRRARRLSGRRLSGAARSRHRAGLDRRYFDRRHQRRHHCRQRGRLAARSPARVLESGRTEAVVGRHAVRHGDRPQRRRIGRRCFNGISGYYAPNRAIAWGGLNALVGVEQAAFYTTDDLRKTVGDIVDFERLNAKQTRLTVGAVNVRTGKMHYFDSRNLPITLDHVLASGALPPGFPGDPHRRRSVLGRRPLFQHADRGGVRRQSAARFRGVLGADISRSPDRSRNRSGR